MPVSGLFKGAASLDVCGSEHARSFNGSITPPLRGSRRSRAGSHARRRRCPEPVEGLLSGGHFDKLNDHALFGSLDVIKRLSGDP